MMKIPAARVTLAFFCAATLLTPSFGEPESIRVHEVTVFERMLPPLLGLLAAEYNKADLPRKREIEYSAYLANRTYWVHTYKFHHQRSPLVENALGLLNAELLSSDMFIELYRDWKTHHPESYPSGTRYFTNLKDGTELSFQLPTTEKWVEMHAELLGFVELTAKTYRAKVDPPIKSKR